MSNMKQFLKLFPKYFHEWRNIYYNYDKSAKVLTTEAIEKDICIILFNHKGHLKLSQKISFDSKWEANTLLY